MRKKLTTNGLVRAMTNQLSLINCKTRTIPLKNCKNMQIYNVFPLPALECLGLALDSKGPKTADLS